MPETLTSALLETLWQQLAPQGAAAPLHFTGDGRYPSLFPVSELAQASFGVLGRALSALLAERHGTLAPVQVDRRLASLWFGPTLLPHGWALPAAWDALAGDYPTADGWIRLHTNAPHHRRVVEALLGAAADRATLAPRVAACRNAELEAEIVAAGGCAARMMTEAQWQQHPQGQAVAQDPLFLWQPHAAGADRPHWALPRARPLKGIRVLDLTRIIAGPAATRALAGFGAEVLRIDPPGWEEPSMEPDVTAGKRCARLDLHHPQDRATFEQLLAGADVLVHGYRAGALEKLGYGEAQRQALSPGLVDVSLNAYGWHGPWRERRGFDSLVQMSCGIAAGGMESLQAPAPRPLPVQALDHATGCLMAAAVLHGLAERLRHGRGCSVRMSLARTARELAAHRYPAFLAGEPVPPATRRDCRDTLELTAWGVASRLYAPVTLDGTAMLWHTPARPLGRDLPVWSAR
ncbi:acyl-CoA transferase [Chimaeribacter arupi]|uniref:CoA transferase n=1 Tax=Chimaeribacter arupi TaxID=2060066 RepID=UPI000C7AF99C|nr:CoA transferase [Chimaeribacter arupi]PLR42239.1 acyl-CoA transferase [Chimaeribacter arupi]